MKKILAICLSIALIIGIFVLIPENPKVKTENTIEFDFNNVIDLISEPENNINYIEYMVENKGSRTFYDIVVTDDSIWHDLNEYIEIFCYDETDPTYFNEGFVINVKDSTYYLNRR